MKFLWLLFLLTLACKLIIGRWPWAWMAGSAQAQTQTRARNLLGVSRSASHSEIIEAHRRLVAMVHPDRGGTGEQVHEANAARDILLGSLAARTPEKS